MSLILSVKCDGKLISKKIVDKLNSSYLDECDAGAAAGGDAGAPASACDAGDVAAEMSGTTTADVLGVCKPGEGYMGKDNFYIPARATVPLHRWEGANGGSKRKKNKMCSLPGVTRKEASAAHLSGVAIARHSPVCASIIIRL